MIVKIVKDIECDYSLALAQELHRRLSVEGRRTYIVL